MSGARTGGGSAFSEKIRAKESGALLYGITPPKERTDPEALARIAAKRTERINALAPDALVVYDIQDESARTEEERPFAFFPTLDPLGYADGQHAGVSCEKVVYHAVGKYGEEELAERIRDADAKGHLSVFVGAASRSQPARTRLDDAYRVRAAAGSRGLLGAVLIPERHRLKGDEHLRILEKQRKGCSFFVSQCVCDVDLMKDFISDYYWAARDRGAERAYLVFTLSICGTRETLAFMGWLGIDVPRWMRNDLERSGDFLEESVRQNLRIALELRDYCAAKGMAYGFNVERVSPKKEEIDASVRLYEALRRELPR